MRSALEVLADVVTALGLGAGAAALALAVSAPFGWPVEALQLAAALAGVSMAVGYVYGRRWRGG